MIRIDDATRIGPALAQVRNLLGYSRQELATHIAEVTGRNPKSVANQIAEWDRLENSPTVSKLGPLLDALPPPLEPLDVSAIDGFLAGVVLQPQPVPASRWLPHVTDLDARPAPPGRARAPRGRRPAAGRSSDAPAARRRPDG